MKQCDIVDRLRAPTDQYGGEDQLQTEAATEITRLRNKGLTFTTLREANLARLPTFKNAKGKLAHSEPDGSDWNLSAWSNAVCGELGEAANLIKKIERGDFSLDEAREELAKELADIVTYLDLLAIRAGVNLGQATIAKFNEVSIRVGSPIRLQATDWSKIDE